MSVHSGKRTSNIRGPAVRYDPRRTLNNAVGEHKAHFRLVRPFQERRFGPIIWLLELGADMTRPSRMGKTSEAKARNASPAKARKASKAKRCSVSDPNNDLKEARAQQEATAEILKVIASSPSDVQPVFEAI